MSAVTSRPASGNCKADIRNPSLQLCWQGLASLLAHERSRFAICQWELSTPTDRSIPPHPPLSAPRTWSVGMLICVQDVQNNRPQVYALLRSVLNESHWDSAPFRPFRNKKFILLQTSLHSLIFHFADVLNCYLLLPILSENRAADNLDFAHGQC